MRTVYKYPLRGVVTEIGLPPGAVVRHVAEQGEQMCVWVELDAAARPSETRTFHVVGTGHPIPPDLTFVGTVQSPPFVWHIYEGASR